MASVRDAQVSSIYLFFIIYRHPPIEISLKRYWYLLHQTSKALDKVWHKTLISNLPPVNVYPSVYTLLEFYAMLYTTMLLNSNEIFGIYLHRD